jgi:chromatin remodeling complex protein RSC6
MVAKKNQAPVVTASPPVAVSSTPAKEVKEKAPKTTEAKPTAKTAEPKSAAKVAEPAPVTVASPAVASPAEAENPLDAVFAKLTAAVALFKEIQTNLKVLQKTYDKMKKVVDKQERKKISARTTPSGFAKPTKISDELCAFLGVAKGTMMSRTEVTRSINLYVKEHNLYDPSNRRIINPDANLKKILVLKPGEILSFFTLQRAIKGHFASSVKA